jgi:hypothetical protein
LSFEERETWPAVAAIPSGCKHLCGVLRFDGDLTGPIYVLKSTGRFIRSKSGVLPVPQLP